jgi:hypothetical protein
MSGSTLREQLAAIEHERWAHWQSWMHSACRDNGDGSLTIPAELVERWERQIRTPYADLSEAEKKSDREQVDRYLPLVTADYDALAARLERAEKVIAEVETWRWVNSATDAHRAFYSIAAAVESCRADT